MAKSWEQIIGGYATDTLSEDEKRQLFEAALEDQTLFEALADEEALKALLADPESRQRILESLQASGNPQGTPVTHGSWLGWFRQPSSLAWAGSIAAVGLALIFGWQLEKEWGPMFERELQTERAVPEEKDEVATQSQTSRIEELKEHVPEAQKKDQRNIQQFSTKPAPPARTESPVITQDPKDMERTKEAPTKVPSGLVSRQKTKKALQLKTKAPAPPTPQTAFAQKEPQAKNVLAPTLEDTAAREVDSQKLTKAPAFADQMQKRDTLSSTRVRELFYRNKSELVDTSGAVGGMRSQQLLGRLSSKIEEVLEEEALERKETEEADKKPPLALIRGIRYGFQKRRQEDQSNVVDLKQFSGNWEELQLVIEANVSGHLYVLSAMEKGKWQMMTSQTLNLTKSSDGSLHVKPYQAMTFALSQLTNQQGKLLASFITVLFSPTPIPDLGTWLGVEKTPEQYESRFRQSGNQGTFVLDRSLNLEKPFRVDIPLP